MIEKNESRKGCNFLFPAFLLGLIFLFLLPLLAGWEKMFFDDIAFLFYPQQIFLSRCLAKGIIPWWDPHICAGATPFYTRLFQSSLYPLNWPFLYLGHISPARDYFWLVRAPLTLHYLLSALFAFLFARLGLRLNQVGSFVLAVAYTLSPTMIYMSTYPPEVFVQAWLPLFCLCLIMFYRYGRHKWLILGAVAFAISSPGGDVPYVMHVVLITALFGIGLVVLALARCEWKKAIRVPLGGIAIFGIGFLLAGIYWGNMIEGLKMMGEGSAEEVTKLSGPHQSMHPLYLITLFIPDFFGGITSCHTWGSSFHIHCSLNDANLLGGLAMIVLVVLGFKAVMRRSESNAGEPSPEGVWWIFFTLFIFSIFTVLGAYTPVYYILRKLIPVLKIPYPIRFRSIECFAMAGLLGTSVSLLWSRAIKNRQRGVWVTIVLVVLFIVLALLWPYQAREARFSPGGSHLTALGDWSWFVWGPLSYLIIIGAVIALGAKYMSARSFLVLLLVMVIGECFIFAYGGLYRSRILNRRDEDFSAVRFRGPSHHPMYKVIGREVSETADKSDRDRWAYFRSYFDNLAWLNGSLSILGFDIKPLDKRFQDVVKGLVKGFPYELSPKKWDSWFWPNMSVRYVLLEKPVSFPKWKQVKKIGAYYLYELTNSLPRFYFQDRWVPDDDEQKHLRALREFDLRDSGYCHKDIWGARPSSEEYPVSQTLQEEEWVEHFATLQKNNKIISTDLSNPNRVVLEVDVSQPCMLVLTDVWHPDWRVVMGEFGGGGQKVHQVNCLQRGVWCRMGRYKIVMEFFPSSLRTGLAMTAGGLIILLGLILLYFKKQLLC